MHLCEMYVCMRPSVHLFCHLHVLHFARRCPTHIGIYYFQHRSKGPSKYITTLSPGKWDCWREGLVIAYGDARDRLELLAAVPMARHSD
jgi:hypothetical protein